MYWLALRARVLIRKLSYLKRVLSADYEKLGSQVFRVFAERDVSNLTIVEQCRYLEGVYGTNFTGEVLTSRLFLRDVQKAILTADKEFRLKGCETCQSLMHVTRPGIPTELSWLKIWLLLLIIGQDVLRLLYLFSMPSPG